MSARKIPKNYRSITGFVALSDGSETKGFESSLERDFLILLDFDITVHRFDEQPVKIIYADDEGRERTYTPDVLVRYRNDFSHIRHRRPCLYEVKYREDLAKGWKKFRPKFKAAVRYAKNNGWNFKIVTEREIRGPYLDNAKFLRGYIARSGTYAEQSLILVAMNELREADPSAVLQAISDQAITRAALLPVLWHLIARRRIGTDLTQPLTMASRIWAIRG